VSTKRCRTTSRPPLVLYVSPLPLHARVELISSAVQTLKQSWPRLLRAWVYVPFGTVLIMLVLWGIDSIIRLTGVSFPASVAAMLLLFLGLIALEAALGEKKAKSVVKVVEVPV
jgi:hypothetical protein